MHLNPRDVRADLRRGPHDVLDIGHSRIAHWRFGSGPDLVFVHGWPLHSATYRDVVSKLAHSFTCHLFDLPGVGHTVSNPDAPIGLAEHGETVRKVVDALGLTRFAYIGHDSGGTAARIAAAGDPRVTGLVLGNTEIPDYTTWWFSAAIAGMRLPVGPPVFRMLLRWRLFRRCALAFGICFRDAALIEGEFFEWFVAPMLASREVANRQFRLIQNFDIEVLRRLPEVHAKIAAPTLLIWGTDDTFFPIARARAMMSQFDGGAELREIPGGRLLAHEEFATDFAAHAEAFLHGRFRNRERANAVGTAAHA